MAQNHNLVPPMLLSRQFEEEVLPGVLEALRVPVDLPLCVPTEDLLTLRLQHIRDLDAILSGCVGHGASHAVPLYLANTPVVGVGHPDDRGHGVVRAGYVVFEIVLPQKIQDRINVHDPKVLGVVLDALVGVIGCVEAVVVHVIVGVVCYDVVIHNAGQKQILVSRRFVFVFVMEVLRVDKECRLHTFVPQGLQDLLCPLTWSIVESEIDGCGFIDLKLCQRLGGVLAVHALRPVTLLCKCVVVQSPWAVLHYGRAMGTPVKFGTVHWISKVSVLLRASELIGLCVAKLLITVDNFIQLLKIILQVRPAWH